MEKNVSLLSLFIKNSFIALAVHICLCLVTICLIRGLLSLVNAPMTVSLLIAATCGLISLYVYFLVGKKYLHTTTTILMDYVSLFGFFALLIVAVIFIGGISIFSLWSFFWVAFANSPTPYEPMEQFLHSIVLIPGPPFIMWMGMIVRRRKAELEAAETQNYGKL